MEKKKNCWITPDYYLDTDFYIVSLLCEYYQIEWYIVSRGKTVYDDELGKMSSIKNIRVSLELLPYRNRSLKLLFAYCRLALKIKKSQPDYFYTGLHGYPYALPVIKIILGKVKTIVPLHNVNIPKGASCYRFAKWNTGRILNSFKNYQSFSLSQFNLLKSLKPRANVFYTPFLLKDYGKPTVVPNKKITFLNFGNIRDYKRVDVLIDAAQRAFEKTGVEFIVEIAGACIDWEKYQAMIRYPQLFNLNIRKVDNEEIPNLFGRSHYFVVPYQDIAQSGSVVVGINYDKPIIASDLEAFREYVKDGMDGYLMKPASVDDLTQIMIDILRNHDRIYPQLVAGLKQIKEEKFATAAIVQKYIHMFESLK